MPLTALQMERYSRHLLLQKFGGQTQERLLAAQVVVVSQRETGELVTRYLAAAGVGRIQLCRLEGAFASSHPLTMDYPDCQVTLTPWPTPTQAAASLVQGCDLLLSIGLEQRERLALNQMAWGKPHITAWWSDLGTIDCANPRIPAAPCLACFPPVASANPPLPAHMIPLLSGWLETVMAGEALKALTGLGEGLTGTRLLLHPMDGACHRLAITRHPACPQCGQGTQET